MIISKEYVASLRGYRGMRIVKMSGNELPIYFFPEWSFVVCYGKMSIETATHCISYPSVLGALHSRFTSQSILTTISNLLTFFNNL